MSFSSASAIPVGGLIEKLTGLLNFFRLDGGGLFHGKLADCDPQHDRSNPGGLNQVGL